MKIALDLGHGCPPDTGAIGLRSEESMIEEVGKYLIPLLQAQHEVILVRPKKASSVGHSLVQRIQKANEAKVNLFISLHFNCFNKNTNGAEIFAISATGKKYANLILAEIVKLGYFDRKVKDGSQLYVVKNTSAPAILIEGCFCDNQKDLDLFDAEKMAVAIAEGISSLG